MGHLKGTETIVDHSLREMKKHGSEGFPFAAYLDDFSSFQNGYICWHWHDEVQITLIVEGDFICQMGSEKILMKPGESIFINSCALHQIYPCRNSYGKLYSFIWRADILTGITECDAYQHCIANILNGNQKYLLFNRENSLCETLRTSLTRIVNLMSEKEDFFELRIYHQLSKIWLNLCDYQKYIGVSGTMEGASYIQKAKDDERVKNAMQYMQENYNEDISLDDIAKAAFTSRSELCKSFRRALDTSPKEFLIQYRIRQSMVLLENLSLRISDISEMTGFSSPSHYGSCFQKYVGCTPLQYRKNI